jgi:hypothetical protein
VGPKVFNIGLNRAGTTSLTTALGLLGYRALHFHHAGQRLYDLVVANHRRRYRLFDGLDDDYDAFSDFAGQNFYRALDKQYPGSKFILTWRDLTSWLDSRERKVRHNITRPGYRYAFRTVDRAGWQRERETYLADLERYFADRPGDLLIIDIPGGQGWDQLCPFLGRAVPAAPFPCENRLAESA